MPEPRFAERAQRAPHVFRRSDEQDPRFRGVRVKHFRDVQRLFAGVPALRFDEDAIRLHSAKDQLVTHLAGGAVSDLRIVRQREHHGGVVEAPRVLRRGERARESGLARHPAPAEQHDVVGLPGETVRIFREAAVQPPRDGGETRTQREQGQQPRQRQQGAYPAQQSYKTVHVLRLTGPEAAQAAARVFRGCGPPARGRSSAGPPAFPRRARDPARSVVPSCCRM